MSQHVPKNKSSKYDEANFTGKPRHRKQMSNLNMPVSSSNYSGFTQDNVKHLMTYSVEKRGLEGSRGKMGTTNLNDIIKDLVIEQQVQTVDSGQFNLNFSSADNPYSTNVSSQLVGL